MDERLFAQRVAPLLAIGDLSEQEAIDGMVILANPGVIAWRVVAHLSTTALIELAKSSLRLDAAQYELMRRGAIEAVLSWPAAMYGSDLVSEVARRADAELYGSWIETGAEDFLQAIRSNTGEQTVRLLERGSVFVPILQRMDERDGSTRNQAACDDLDARFREENAQGFYEELDYPYGQVDPTLSIAAMWVAAGRLEGGLRYVMEREERCAQLFNLEELHTCVRLLEGLPEREHQAFFDRIHTWAQTTQYGEVGEFSVLWSGLALGSDLVQSVHPEARRCLSAALEPGTTVDALVSVLSAESLPRDIEAIAIARGVEYIHGLGLLFADENTSAGSAAPIKLRSLLHPMVARYGQLSEEQRSRIAESVGTWAQWLTNAQVGDWLTPVFTCVALVPRWRAAVEPAVDRIRHAALTGEVSLANYDGWHTLFTPETVRAILAL